MTKEARMTNDEQAESRIAASQVIPDKDQSSSHGSLADARRPRTWAFLRHSSLGIRHSFVIGYFVIRHFHDVIRRSSFVICGPGSFRRTSAR
jgi:hypothetical protein